MPNKFVANPEVLRTKGLAIREQAQLFLQNVTKVYATLQNMLATDYLDPAMRELASQIESHREDLYKMTKVIADYATYCVNASNSVIKNQNNITSNIRVTE